MARRSATRREFLTLIGSGAAAVALSGCRRGRSVTLSAPAGGAFAQPEVLSSRDGRLAVTLTAQAGAVPYGSATRYAYTYNGSTPGPTLRVRPGDQLVVTLVNELDADTNLHTHGLHVSPLGGADNIFIVVPPGGSHTYTYDIPVDHRSGLFWYHPHAHGHVADQIAAGLAGAIVVTDAIDDRAEMAASTERLWILADPPIGSGVGSMATSAMTRMQGREGDRVLVNGIAEPDVAVLAGALERWRLVNASAARYYRLALDGHQVNVIASDGGRLIAPVAVNEILLAPGERTELLVTPMQSGVYRFRALAYDRGSAGMAGGTMGGRGGARGVTPIATMTVTGVAAAASLPAVLADAAPMPQPSAQPSRTITLAMGAGAGGMGSGGSMMSLTIDGKTFDATRTDIAARLGSVEEWTVRNTSAMDHPFHLHVWPFQIVDGPRTSGWKDTVNVPAGGEVRIRIPVADFAGRTVYHCHILDHEDLGMMGVIDVAQ